MMLVIIIAISGYLIGAVGIGMALGARLKIDSLEQEIAERLLLYPETPATRSVVFPGTSVPDASGSVLASAEGSKGDRDEALAPESAEGVSVSTAAGSLLS